MPVYVKMCTPNSYCVFKNSFSLLFFSRMIPAQAPKTSPPPPKKDPPVSWLDDDTDDDDYTARTYNPETYVDDELEYADDEPESLSILERLALLEKAQTTPVKDSDGKGGPSSSKGASPDLTEKPKKVKKWTRAKEAHLCSLWEEEVHLYDTKDKDYRNNRRKEKALNRMSAILELDGEYLNYCPSCPHEIEICTKSSNALFCRIQQMIYSHLCQIVLLTYVFLQL